MKVAAGRLTKQGSCAVCEKVDTAVSWHLPHRRWYCEGCWPLPVGVVAGGGAARSWDGDIPTRAELLEMRDGLYGIRVEDSESAVAHFRVRCPEHGWLADGLGIGQARRLCDDHRTAHMTAEVGLPQ